MTKKIRPSIVKAEVKVENIEEKADSTNATVADMSDDSYLVIVGYLFTF